MESRAEIAAAAKRAKSQAVGWAAMDQDGQTAATQVLLIGYILVHRDQHIKTLGFGCVQESAVLQAGDFGEPRRLAIMGGEQEPKPFIDAFV
jgi:hypothetical protein